MSLDSYDRRFLACRDLRHAWTEVGYYRDAMGGVHRWLMCSRCGTERYDSWAATVSRNYDYPSGYLLPGQHIKPAEVRAEVLARVTVHPSLDALQKTERRRRRRRAS